MTFEIPERYKGDDSISIYQSLNGRYHFNYIFDYRKNIEKLIAAEDSHERTGDRHVRNILDVSLDALEGVDNFLRSIDTKVQLTTEDISLEEIFGEGEEK